MPSGDHCLCGTHWEGSGVHPLTLDRCLGIRGVTAPCCNVVPYLHSYQGSDTELDRLAIPDHGCSEVHDVAIILESDGNARTVSVSESHSTPSGCSWPNPMHSSIASSSPKEVGSKGVPSPWVVTSMQI